MPLSSFYESRQRQPSIATNGRDYEDCKQFLKLSLNLTHTLERPERQWPLPKDRQCPQPFPMGRAVPEDCHSASAGSSGTPNIRPSMTRFARLYKKRCRDSARSPEKFSGTTPFLLFAPGWLRSYPKIFPTNHRDSTLSSPTAPWGHNRLRYLQCDS